MPFDDQRDLSGNSLIYVHIALQAAQDAEVLLQLRHKRKDNTPASQALWNGYWQLRQEVLRCVSIARDRGQILFAFSGTTVLQGGAP
jgi:hypothetical protein